MSLFGNESLSSWFPRSEIVAIGTGLSRLLQKVLLELKNRICLLKSAQQIQLVSNPLVHKSSALPLDN